MGCWEEATAIIFPSLIIPAESSLFSLNLSRQSRKKGHHATISIADEHDFCEIPFDVSIGWGRDNKGLRGGFSMDHLSMMQCCVLQAGWARSSRSCQLCLFVGPWGGFLILSPKHCSLPLYYLTEYQNVWPIYFAQRDYNMTQYGFLSKCVNVCINLVVVE